MVVSCLDFSCAVSMFSRDRTARPQGQYHRFNGTHTWSIGTWNGTFNILFHFTTPHTCNRTLLFLKIKLIEEKNILKKCNRKKKEKIFYSHMQKGKQKMCCTFCYSKKPPWMKTELHMLSKTSIVKFHITFSPPFVHTKKCKH